MSKTSICKISGFKKVALKAVVDISPKVLLKMKVKSEEEFKRLWKIECQKKALKSNALKLGTWKTKLSRVSYFDDEVPQPIVKKMGRFVVTEYSQP